jgi:hypothetical protein
LADSRAILVVEEVNVALYIRVAWHWSSPAGVCFEVTSDVSTRPTRLDCNLSITSLPCVDVG